MGLALVGKLSKADVPLLCLITRWVGGKPKTTISGPIHIKLVFILGLVAAFQADEL